MEKRNLYKSSVPAIEIRERKFKFYTSHVGYQYFRPGLTCLKMHKLFFGQQLFF